jgi:hypothetical protein
LGSGSTTKIMQVKFSKVIHKVLKNSLHGQIWSDFEKVSLKMSGKAFVKMTTKQIPVTKIKITNDNFLTNFVRAPIWFFAHNIIILSISYY